MTLVSNFDEFSGNLQRREGLFRSKQLKMLLQIFAIIHGNFKLGHQVRERKNNEAHAKYPCSILILLSCRCSFHPWFRSFSSSAPAHLKRDAVVWAGRRIMGDNTRPIRGHNHKGKNLSSLSSSSMEAKVSIDKGGIGKPSVTGFNRLGGYSF